MKLSEKAMRGNDIDPVITFQSLFQSIEYSHEYLRNILSHIPGEGKRRRP